MKPSERVQQIYDENHNPQDRTEITATIDLISSIMVYLDEKYELEQKGRSTLD